MAKLLLCDMELSLPDNWDSQGMVTLTLPSTDKTVRPNIIVSKEQLGQQVSLTDYFAKIKQSILARGIRSLEIIEEFDLELAGIPAKELICRWDLSEMKGANPKQDMSHIKPGQFIQQIQVTLVREKYAVNFTASFPADQFGIYQRPFDRFVESLAFV